MAKGLRTIKPIESEINSVERYEAVLDMMRLLNRRFCIATALDYTADVTYACGEEYDRCERCDKPLFECRENGGHDDDPWHDEGDIYNDESIFD